MIVGDQVELWYKNVFGEEQEEYPCNGVPLVVSTIGCPNSQMFQATQVNPYTGRKESYNFYIDPSRYDTGRNGNHSWKGLTVQYYLDQVMDSDESLL